MGINGSNLGSDTTYYYCFESGATLSSFASCPAGSATFTTDASGNIPVGVNLTATGQSGLVVISKPGGFVKVMPFAITSGGFPWWAVLMALLLLLLLLLWFLLGWRRKCKCGRKLIDQNDLRVCPACSMERKNCQCEHT